jgi:hypothetical protein
VLLVVLGVVPVLLVVVLVVLVPVVLVAAWFSPSPCGRGVGGGGTAQ